MNPRHQQFVGAYLADPDLNAARAYRAVYPAASAETARRSASRLLGLPAVAAAVREAMAGRLARSRLSGDRVLQELARLAFGDGEPPTPTPGPAGGAKPPDRKPALILLGRHLGLFATPATPATARPAVLDLSRLSGEQFDHFRSLVALARPPDPPAGG